MAMDPEDKVGMFGCLGGLAAIAALVGGIVWFSNTDFTSEPEAAAPQASSSGGSSGGSGARGSGSKAPISKIEPTAEKTVVAKALDMEKLGRYVPPEISAEPPPEPPKGVVAAVQNLGPVPGRPPRVLPPQAAQVQQVLESEALCWHGRIAHRAPSLFTDSGFAVTYGSDGFEGDPLPRLEIFLTPVGNRVMTTYMSMSAQSVKGFPDNQETVIPYSSEAINEVIAKWIVAVADGTCPPPAQRAR